LKIRFALQLCPLSIDSGHFYFPVEQVSQRLPGRWFDAGAGSPAIQERDFENT